MKYKVKGTSMFPTYQEGNMVELIPGLNEVQVGDVVVFLDNQKRLIAHRLYFYHKEFFITRGDNHSYFDHISDTKNILGSVKDGRRSVPNHFTLENFNNTCKKNQNLVLVTNKRKFNQEYNLPLENPLNSEQKYVLLYDDTQFSLTEIYEKQPFISAFFIEN